jgi:nucleotide-binding universal stress UspA family protein
MAYRTLLLCLNETSRLNELATVGRMLAAKFKAHVSGLYVIPGSEIYLTPGFADVPNISEARRKDCQDQLDKVRSTFADAMKDDGLTFDFRLVDSQLASVASEQIAHSRAADMIITTAVDRNTVAGADVDSVERLVMAAGRPVLVLPHQGEVKLAWDEVIVCWDDSREAARAAFDAMPYLQAFKKVRIVTVDAGPRGQVPGALIAATLTRHGVKVEVSSLSPDGLSVGEALQRAADDCGASTIVLGAYGHSRLMEFIFGGVTRHMLKNVTRPLLMSH